MQMQTVPTCNMGQIAMCNVASWPDGWRFRAHWPLAVKFGVAFSFSFLFLFTLALVLAMWICFWRFATAICLRGKIQKQHTTQTASTQSFDVHCKVQVICKDIFLREISIIAYPPWLRQGNKI